MKGNTNSMVGSNSVTPEPSYTQLINYTMLYDEGDECKDVTGGISIVKDNGATVTKNTDNIQIDSVNGTYFGSCGVYTKNKISGNVKLFARFEQTRTAYSNANGSIYNALFSVTAAPTLTNTTLSNTVEYEMKNVLNSATMPAGMQIRSIDITDGLMYGFFVTASTTGTKATTNLYNMWLVKEDNWQEWIGKCGYTTDDYATLDDVLADASALETLMNNEDAVKYMIYRCTGSVMAKCIASQTAIDAIADSKYIDMIYGNVHWKKFLDMIGFAPRTYLYKNGDECEDLTGGWSKDGYTYYDSTSGQSYTVQGGTKNTDNLYFKPSSGNYACLLGTANSIDMNEYSSLCVEYMSSGVSGALGCSLISSKALKTASLVSQIVGASTEKTVMKMDLSAITTENFIVLYNTYNNTRTATVYKVWLE